jgi:hypothetical protein
MAAVEITGKSAPFIPTMTNTDKPGESSDTELLELKSLHLDLQVLRQERDDNKREFVEFSANVQKNFVSIQTNFRSIQANFDKLFQSVKLAGDTPLVPVLPVSPADGQGSNNLNAPRPHPSRPCTAPAAMAVGTAALRDAQGHDLKPGWHTEISIPTP